MVKCENCNKLFERADQLDHQEVPKLDLKESGRETPKIRIGTGTRDVWRCTDCGAVLGVQ